MKLKPLVRHSKLSRAISFLSKPTLVVSLIVTGLLLGMRQLGSLQRLEIFALDQMIHLKPDAEPDSRFLIVGITEPDIQAQQQWPLSDLVIAQLLSNLQQHEPLVIGMDIHRDIPHPPGNQELREQLQAENLITITHLGHGEDEFVPSPPNVPTERVGFDDLVVDPDGILRRNFMFGALGEEQFYSLSFRLSLAYLKHYDISFQVTPDAILLGDKVFARLKSDSGGYQTIDSAGYQILINYRSSEKVAREISLNQVLQGDFDPTWVKDKIVLIGTVAPSAKDLFYTPYSVKQTGDPRMPGVLIHTQMASQIIGAVLDEQPLFWFWNQWVEALWIWSWSLLGAWVTLRLKHPLYLLLTQVICLVGLGSVCFVLFLQMGWIPILPPALAFATTSIIILILHHAFHDALTGLPNRALFIKQLQWALVQAGEVDCPPVVMFLGLDRFKVINESMGHKAGDQILMMTVKRLQECLRVTDQVARVGGDQFAIMLKEMRKVPDAMGIAERVEQMLKRSFRVNDQEVFTTVSVGIAFKQIGTKQRSEDLLQDAQTAMYRAKALGGERIEVFAMDMRAQVVSRFQLEADLRQAIERKEFELYYQPIVSLTTGKIAGFEALVRWHSPERGFVSPGKFIPVTEETGLIIPLGKWITQQACRQMQSWQEEFSPNSPLMMSVNLSPKQFAQQDLITQIKEILQETGLNSLSLKLEITESMVMHDVESAIALLSSLKDVGIRLSMDDFGTGYSSLSYLHRFPLDTLKVDQSFVRHMEYNPEEDTIVRTIVMLGHNLGMDVIAEGIETAEQLAKLRSLGCEYGQGYFFSKPLPADQATELLKKSPRW